MHASAPSIYTKAIEALKLSHKEYSSILWKLSEIYLNSDVPKH
jgi:hypothetical protein